MIPMAQINSKIISQMTKNSRKPLISLRKPWIYGYYNVVRITGLEPARRLTIEPKSIASANSAISA